MSELILKRLFRLVSLNCIFVDEKLCFICILQGSLDLVLNNLQRLFSIKTQPTNQPGSLELVQLSEFYRNYHNCQGQLNAEFICEVCLPYVLHIGEIFLQSTIYLVEGFLYQRAGWFYKVCLICRILCH